jgi:hypothetical protein
MKVTQIPLRRQLGTALSLAALCLAALSLAPSAALAASPLPQPDPPWVTSTSAITTTTTMTTLSFGTTTDAAQVITGYDLQELESGSWTTIDTVSDAFPGEKILSQQVLGLNPATSYEFAVVAFDAAGDLSPRSGPVTVTTLPTTQFPVCQVIAYHFAPSFVVVANITNTTASTLTDPSVSFTMPSNTSVRTIYNATLALTATGGTLTANSNSATVAPGGETSVGFEGSVSPYIPPSGFTLNGQPCTPAT